MTSLEKLLPISVFDFYIWFFPLFLTLLWLFWISSMLMILLPCVIGSRIPFLAFAMRPVEDCLKFHIPFFPDFLSVVSVARKTIFWQTVQYCYVIDTFLMQTVKLWLHESRRQIGEWKKVLFMWFWKSSSHVNIESPSQFADSIQCHIYEALESTVCYGCVKFVFIFVHACVCFYSIHMKKLALVWVS